MRDYYINVYELPVVMLRVIKMIVIIPSDINLCIFTLSVFKQNDIMLRVLHAYKSSSYTNPVDLNLIERRLLT